MNNAPKTTTYKLFFSWKTNVLVFLSVLILLNIFTVSAFAGTSANSSASVIEPTIPGETGGGGGGASYNSVKIVVPVTGQETEWFLKEVERTDIVRDGKIDVLDFDALMVNWGKKGVDNPADVNQDGSVDIFDFNTLMVHWGKTEII